MQSDGTGDAFNGDAVHLDVTIFEVQDMPIPKSAYLLEPFLGEGCQVVEGPFIEFATRLRPTISRLGRGIVAQVEYVVVSDIPIHLKEAPKPLVDQSPHRRHERLPSLSPCFPTQDENWMACLDLVRKSARLKSAMKLGVEFMAVVSANLENAKTAYHCARIRFGASIDRDA